MAEREEVLKKLRPAMEALIEVWGELAVPSTPPAPTRAWCLPAPGTVRWRSEAHLRPRLWDLLAYLLDHEPGPVPVADLEDHVYHRDVPDQRLRYDLWELNRVLLGLSWPWDYHLRQGAVSRS